MVACARLFHMAHTPLPNLHHLSAKDSELFKQDAEVPQCPISPVTRGGERFAWAAAG